MSRFVLPHSAGFADADRIGKYLAEQLGPGYQVSHQEEQLLRTRAGRRGEFGRWINQTCCGDFSVIVSSNPLFGSTVRFYLEGNRSLVLVRGAIPNQLLRETILPWLGLAVMFASLVLMVNVVRMLVFLGVLPLLLVVPRLLALPLTTRTSRLLSDTKACEAAGIQLLPDQQTAIAPADAGKARLLGGLKVVFGLAIAVGAVLFAASELDQPYTSTLWADVLAFSSLASGLGLSLLVAGVSNVMLRRLNWIYASLLALALSGLSAGGWAIVAPQVCPASMKYSTTSDPPQAKETKPTEIINKN